MQVCNDCVDEVEDKSYNSNFEHEYILILDVKGRLQVWSRKTSILLCTLVESSDIEGLAVLENKYSFASCSKNGNIVIWDAFLQISILSFKVEINPLPESISLIKNNLLLNRAKN